LLFYNLSFKFFSYHNLPSRIQTGTTAAPILVQVVVLGRDTAIGAKTIPPDRPITAPQLLDKLVLIRRRANQYFGTSAALVAAHDGMVSRVYF
jgi:hypothetical protein